MKPLLLSKADEEILHELGRYRLLTQAHFVQLGISGRKNIGERLKRLVNAKYVANIEGTPLAPGVYWLTPKAATHFTALFGPEWARAASAGFEDGKHMAQRIATVDVNIALRAWVQRVGFQLVTLRTDFEAGDNGLKRATTIKWKDVTYTPDALGDLIDGDGVPWALALEVETGGLSERLDNFTKMLPHRRQVLAERVIDYGNQRPSDGRAATRMMFVFSSTGMLERALRSIPDPEARHWRAAFFKALPNVREDFGGEWRQADGSLRFPFQRVEPNSIGRP
jgi:hypothetical protein